ncbi:unnamed protein product [Cyclocybe aegerita]|uniref:Hydrophobin n=1 Tax=Cyclocybe aegerita TaxID=1973307 RepID=A0A8S0VQJ6_CYCAE|nr:unnamed protein product [Cyclocybe aegerita]
MMSSIASELERIKGPICSPTFFTRTNSQHSFKYSHSFTNMQFKVSVLTAVALSTLAVGTPVKRDESGGGGQCNTGPVQCCNSVQQASSSPIYQLLGLLGVVAGPIDALIGLTCNPISVIGIGGNSCTSQPVCCTNNNFNGVVALGCTPINVNL